MVRTNSHAECVLYEDHVAAMQAARPQPKFKVGDVVTSSPWPEPWIIEQVEYAAFADTWCYFGADGFYKFECNLTLHVPLIPDPKFKVGDRVTWKRMQGSRIVESSIFRPYNNTYEYYIKGPGELFLWEDELELYVPPVTTCGCPGGYVKEATAPDPKFKVGDVVVTALKTTPWAIVSMQYREVNEEWYYRSSSYRLERECNVYIYIPLTPAELIPTLKEHEWVRGTNSYDEKPFEGTVFFAHGAVMVGLNILAPKDSPPNPHITSIERCDAPVQP